MHVDGCSRELVLNSVLVRLSVSRSNTMFYNIVFGYGSESKVLAGGDVAGVKVSLNPEITIELVLACVVFVDSTEFLSSTVASVVSMKEVIVAGYITSVAVWLCG